MRWFSPWGGEKMKTTTSFLKMKKENEKIVMLTAYDYSTARFAEEAGVDLILVGDSLGMVVLGYDSTASVTVDDMIHHGKATRRGAKDTFIVIDMPFGSYHGTYDRTLQEAVHIYQETNANALKLEGAGEVLDVLRKLTEVGIPTVAHLGLLPQHAGVLGGYRVQGKTKEAAAQLMSDAKEAERAGACMIVLECVPYQIAGEISRALNIPVIGIGAGAETDGQVLVFHDTVQFGYHHIPKFVQQFGNAQKTIHQGLSAYVNAVKECSFPSENHRFTMQEEELTALYGMERGKQET